MKCKQVFAQSILSFLALSLSAAEFVALTSTNAISLKFDNGVPISIRNSIHEDFQYCLVPSAAEIGLYHFEDAPTNHYSLVGLWSPYCFSATSGLGPDLPEEGILSNSVFTIDVSYAYATNYQHHLETSSAYSNEIDAAYSFIDSLSLTNLQTLATNELLSMELMKDVPPGQCMTLDEGDKGFYVECCRSARFYAPPRIAFHIWDCGPTNTPPYLWCTVPVAYESSHTSARLMIYYQGRWWFSSWPFQEGEQQW